MSAPRLLIGLSAVMVALKDGEPNVLVTRRPSGEDALPFGPFDPANHRTFDLSLRGWVREQTGFEIGYVEQLYTFGDKDRETPEVSLMDANAESRVISVGYLALTPEARPAGASFEARWQDWYHYFPWRITGFAARRSSRSRSSRASRPGPWATSAGSGARR